MKDFTWLNNQSAKVTRLLQNCCSQRHERDFPTWLSLALGSYELSEKTQHGLACPSSSSCCGFPFSILREIDLWLRFISRRKAELMRFSWYTAQHTHQVKEKKMKNWNDKVALLACCQSNWSDLCCWGVMGRNKICTNLSRSYFWRKGHKIHSLSIYGSRKSLSSFLIMILKQNENKTHSESAPKVKPSLSYPWK